ncbi:MAG: hypothetical protein ACFE9D_00565 [Promethearchaeota archaeon]
MARPRKTVKTTKYSEVSERTQHYILKPFLHPNGWKLEVREGNGLLLFTVLKHPTTPPQFKLLPANKQKIGSLRIKTTVVRDVLRYTLRQGKQELLSILQALNSPLVSVRNQQHETIARFSTLSPEIVLLRAIRGSVAHLRFKEKPEPFGFQIECDAQPLNQWLYAIILYAVARIESYEPNSHLEEKTQQDEDVTAENVKQ